MIFAFGDTIPYMKLFPDSISRVGWIVLIGFGAGISILLAIAAYRYYNQRRQLKAPLVVGNPDILLEYVADSLNLTFSDRRFLKRLAREMQIAQPVSIILTPNLLIIAANFWEVKHTRFVRNWGLERLNTLAKQIYGKTLTELSKDVWNSEYAI